MAQPTALRTSPRPQPAKQSQLWKRIKESASWYPFILYNVFIFVVFNFITWFQLGGLSFVKWDMLSTVEFVGLENYTRMLNDARLHISLVNTLKYLLMYVPCLFAISFVIAVSINQRLPGMRLFRALYFLPVITSVTVLGLIWWRLFSPRPDGPVNYVLGLLSIPPQTWLVDLNLAMPTVVGMSLWGSIGYYMVIWIAGLQGVPAEVYEAAQVDGASGWRLHWLITLPMLRPTAAFILIIATIGSLQVFGEIYILTGGGPVFATSTIVWYMWNSAFQLGRVGYASALTILLFAVILLITWIQMKYLRASEGVY